MSTDLNESPMSPAKDVGHNSTVTPPASPTRVPRNASDEDTHSKEDSPANRSAKKPSVRIKKQYSKIYRIKTKILQNLGKADKTTDEAFVEYESNFNKQQLNANRLHKELSNYLRCARAMHGASKTLFECVSEVFEPEWVGHDLLYVQAQNSDMLWSDFCHKIQDQALVPLSTYVQDFPELRKKIDKRGRKLVDYDSQRHQLENLQRAARRDEYKIARGKDTLETARTTYQSLNKELYETLPSIYDQRIPQTAECLQTLFAAETTFMQESSKIAQEVEAIAEKLNSSKDIYKAKRGVPPKEPKPLPDPATPNARPTISSPIARSKDEGGRPYEEIDFEDKVNGTANPTSPTNTNGDVGQPVPAETNPKLEEIYDIPIGATTDDLPAGVLYKVKASYKYQREDVDEISFEVGELIQVVEYEDPEEQEEGWLCGIKESTNEKGLFPANFTRPI